MKTQELTEIKNNLNKLEEIHMKLIERISKEPCMPIPPPFDLDEWIKDERENLRENAEWHENRIRIIKEMKKNLESDIYVDCLKLWSSELMDLYGIYSNTTCEDILRNVLGDMIDDDKSLWEFIEGQ